jgi:hypothetical protein
MVDAFHVAVFTADGQLEGTGIRPLSRLSPRWLSVCDNLLAQGPAFRSSLGGPLSHIEIKLMSSNGAGLGMFFAHGVLVTSTAYFRGDSPETEKQVLEMLLTSLRNSVPAHLVTSSAVPFEALRSLSARPLNVVVVWGALEVSEQDNELVQELSNHFAGAYLCGARAA